MKKSLSIFAAAALIDSSSTFALSCRTKTKRNFSTKKNEISKLDKLFLQNYSKALFINRKMPMSNGVRINTNSIMYDWLGELKTNRLDSKETKYGSTLFKKVLEWNYSKDFLANDSKFIDKNLNENESMQIYSKSNSISSIFGFVISLFKSAVDSKSAIEMISNLSSLNFNNLTGYAQNIKILSKFDKISLSYLKKSLDANTYKNMNVSEAIDSSIIGLDNAIDKLLYNSDIEVENDSPKTVYNNIAYSTNRLSKNLFDLICGKKSIDFNARINLKPLSEIIRFTRTLLVYISNFSYNELVTRTLKTETIQKMRMKKFSDLKNRINFKNCVKILNFMTFHDEKGNTFKNLLKIIFYSENIKTPTSKNNTSNYNYGYTEILINIILEKLLVDKSKFTNNSWTLFVDAYIRLFLDFDKTDIKKAEEDFDNIIKISLKNLDKNIVEPLNAIIDARDTDAFVLDPFGYFWYNYNNRLNFSIKKMLNLPICDLLKQWSDFTISKNNPSSINLINYRFKDVNLKDIIAILNNRFANEKSSILDFDRLSKWIEILIKDLTLNNILNGVYPKNLENNSTKREYVSNSELERLIKFLVDNRWLKIFSEVIEDNLIPHIIKNNECEKFLERVWPTLAVTGIKVNGAMTYTVSNEEVGKLSIKYVLGKVNNKKSITYLKLVQ